MNISRVPQSLSDSGAGVAPPRITHPGSLFASRLAESKAGLIDSRIQGRRTSPPCRRENATTRSAAPIGFTSSVRLGDPHAVGADRRRLLALSIASTLLLPVLGQDKPAAARGMSALEKKFADAMMAGDDLKKAIDLWGEAIEMAPENSAAWSNRGTVYLQAGRWQESRDNLERARVLDQQAGGDPDPLVLNNLANAEGALDNWDTAIDLYGQAANLGDQEIQAIAMANKSLAYFQTGQEDAAIREARQLLRRDAQFLDMRTALAAYLWASGRERQAEDEWDALQEAQDGLGGEMYSRSTAVARVRNRWPPRCTAALEAFLSVSREGSAMGYDGKVHVYRFPPS